MIMHSHVVNVYKVFHVNLVIATIIDVLKQADRNYVAGTSWMSVNVFMYCYPRHVFALVVPLLISTSERKTMISIYLARSCPVDH